MILASAALWLTACPSLGTRDLPPTLDRAEALAQRGEHAAAARAFEGLARDSSGDDSTRFLLRAVNEWLAANQPSDASRAYDSIGATGNPSLRAQYSLLAVSLRLARGDAPGAWSALSSIAPPAGSPENRQYWTLKQRVALALGRANDAILAQPGLEAALASDSERESSRRALLRELQQAPDRGVKLEPQTAGRDANLRGWLELGLIAYQAQRGARVAPALVSWRTRFPQHVAQSLANQDAIMPPVAALAPPVAAGAHVAVLLPLSGRAAAQAAQVRDGLLASWFLSPAGSVPPLRFYDTGQLPVADALRLASESGADQIIGPLLREEVQAAADYGGARPPLLALNFLGADRAPPDGFVQYALSPEDEARSVARRALADGRGRAIALVPSSDWGERVLAAFTEELNAGGGTVLASASYATGSADHSAAISSLLRINDSKARARRIEAIIGGSVNAQPRRRGDIDFIFVPSNASQARQLRPQLRFFYAGDIPSYATSDAYDGAGAINQDADGLMFPDMPWVLTASPAVTRARAALRSAYGDTGAPRGKLFAFGHDAWTLAAGLRATGGGSLAPVAGLTGGLSLDASRRVRRELEWAQIRGAGIRLLGGGAPDAGNGGR
jgi:outer membrane PBP1 activator LpoA protein